MSALISFIKAIIVRAISRWILSQLVTLLLSLGLIAALSIAVIGIASYMKTRLNGRPLRGEVPRLARALC
ncbi:MAG: hypothetical protein PVF74_01590 [Anaerolineales bacterium]|jgi:hypothetical protein